MKMIGRTILPMAKVFQNQVPTDEFSGGVIASFPILGIKSSKWHYRWKGDDTVITDHRGFPSPAVEVVLIAANNFLTRTYYPIGTYVEGANNRPVCWSSNGIRPDDTVPEPVHSVCASCPMSQWGSGATPIAPKAQACAQRRRTAIVPYTQGGDLTNEEGGGPVLFSVPPSSLRALAEYSDMLKNNAAHPFGVITQMSFDPDPKLAFPKVVFDYLTSLDEAEAEVIAGLRGDERINQILNSQITPDSPEADEAGATGPAASPVKSATAGAAQPVKSATAGAAKPAPTQQAKPAQSAQQPAQQVRPAQAAQPPKPAPQPAQQTAKPAAQQVRPAQAPTPTPGRVGGFGVKPQQTAAQAQTPQQATQTPIAAAMARPAAPPASARTVRPAVQPEPQPQAEVQEEGVIEGEATEVYEEQPAEGAVDELDGAFESVMSNL